MTTPYLRDVFARPRWSAMTQLSKASWSQAPRLRLTQTCPRSVGLQTTRSPPCYSAWKMALSSLKTDPGKLPLAPARPKIFPLQSMTALQRPLSTSTPKMKLTKESPEENPTKASSSFVRKHPIIIYCVVLPTILIIFVPWLITAIGFEKLGPRDRSSAASWQRTYGGNVPKDSWFSFFQKLGMIWR